MSDVTNHVRRIQQLFVLFFLLLAILHPFVRASADASSSSASNNNEDEKIEIETPFGKLHGFSSKTKKCDTWFGIPYAKPPIGNLRFANPIPWDQPYNNNNDEGNYWDATKRGAFCIQNKIHGESEDCLFLNIWRPTTTTKEEEVEEKDEKNSHLLPVMIFIHGGAFTTGSSLSSVPYPQIMEEYNGCHLSTEQNIIVASMNYRLGPFGFTTFDDDDDDDGRSNFGLRDQLMAIRWLKQYISLFGGNPNKMTLFGESAGAMSAIAHLASPESNNRNEDLFQGVISQSGYPVAFSWNQARNVTKEFSNRVKGCRDIDGVVSSSSLRSCLRTKSVKELIQAAGNSLDGTKWLLQQTGWKPVVDGTFLPQHPLKLLSSSQKESNTINKKKKIPLFLGWNTDDSSLFLRLNYPIGFWFHYQYNNWLRKFTKTHNIETQLNDTDIIQVKNLYEHYTDTTTTNLFKHNKKVIRIETDASFMTGTKAAAEAYSSVGRGDVFMYRFNHIPNCSSLKLLAEGVYHTLELPFIFNTADQYFCNFEDEKDKTIGLRMRTMWANFAKYQNPSLLMNDNTNTNISYYSTIPSDIMFPKYTDTNKQILVFDGNGDYVEEEESYNDNNHEDHRRYFSFWHEKIFKKFLQLDMGPPPPPPSLSLLKKEEEEQEEMKN